MYKLRIFLFTTIFPLSMFAGNDIDSLLCVLDNTIKTAQIYVGNKEQTLDELREQLNTASSEEVKFDITAKLYREYKSFKYDSAYVYADQMLSLAEKLEDPNYICESKIALAFSCLSAGLYKEAVEISHSIDTVFINSYHKAQLFDLLSVLYMSMSDFAATDPYYARYREKSQEYCRRSISLFGHDTPEALLVKTRESQLKDDYANALIYAKQYLSYVQPDLHNFAIAVSMLAYFHEVQGDTEKAIGYFAQAAIADIKMAIKETSAIRQLADLLYTRGDIKRAYAYAKLALDDANYYNARQRKIEVGRTLPIIEAGRFEIIEQQKNKLLFFVALISILCIFLVMATLIILNQKRRLNTARLLIMKQNEDLIGTNNQLNRIQQKLSKQNADLMIVNKKLKEANQIKDGYIGFFFSANSSYLEKKDAFQRMVVRKIKNQQFDELLEEFAANDLRKEKEEMFAMFDQVFMKIFPDFVNHYIQLFNIEDQFELKPDMALSPEIRIFALIRLGINKNESIARFLDFSLSTVKNYKSIAKNRSIISNELFEQKIMEIESVETDL